MNSLRNIFVLAVLIILSTGCKNQDHDHGDVKIKIAVIPKMTSHLFFRSIHAGASKAAFDLDVSIDWQGPQRESDRQHQISIVQNFISRGMDAIVLAPSDSRSMVKVVRDATRAKIPVVIFDSGLEGNDHISFVATDNFKGGQLCAERLAEVMEGRKIIMLRQSEGSASTTAREEGFLTRIKELMPNAELLSTNQYAGASLDKAFQVAQNLLNRFKAIDGIYCPSEPTTQAMLRALQLAGKTDELKFVGFDSNSDLVEGLRRGEIDGLAVQDPFRMGYLGVKTAVQYIRGEKVEDRIDTGVYMITSDNMAEKEMQALLDPPIDRWIETSK